MTTRIFDRGVFKLIYVVINTMRIQEERWKSSGRGDVFLEGLFTRHGINTSEGVDPSNTDAQYIKPFVYDKYKCFHKYKPKN